MKYFRDVNHLHNQSKNIYQYLSIIMAEELVGKALIYLEEYLKYCITLFVDGDINKYWEEASKCKNDNEKRELYNRMLIEVSDEERNKRFIEYLDDDKIVTINQEAYDILSNVYIDNFYRMIETNFIDYIWEAQRCE
jgi:hypothetical protein